MFNGMTAMELFNSGMLSIIALFLMKNENRLTRLETSLRIIMRSFHVSVRSSDMEDFEEYKSKSGD